MIIFVSRDKTNLISCLKTRLIVNLSEDDDQSQLDTQHRNLKQGTHMATMHKWCNQGEERIFLGTVWIRKADGRLRLGNWINFQLHEDWIQY